MSLLKLGTTNDNFDRWLCGFTPYYTAVTWYGFDISETIDYYNQNPAGLIWASVMKNIHIDLPNKKFEMPFLGIEEVKTCPSSGLISDKKCRNSYTEYFLKGTAPTQICNKH